MSTLKFNDPEPRIPSNAYRFIQDRRFEYVNYAAVSRSEAEAIKAAQLNDGRVQDAKIFTIKDENKKAVGYRVYITRQQAKWTWPI